jgi:hypothetical protein
METQECKSQWLLNKFACLLSQTGHLVDNRERNGQRRNGKKNPSHTVSSLSLLSDSHGPGNANIKSVANLNDIWLMMGVTFLSRSPGHPPNTKLLNLSEHFNRFFPLRLAFERDCLPLQICQEQERDWPCPGCCRW